MAWTIEDLEQLEQAMRAGDLFVKFQDKEVRKQTLREMEALREQIRLELGLIKPRKVRKIRTRFSKGL